MIVAILLAAYVAVLMAGCHKPKPKTPPPPCAADLFGCWPEDPRK